jgi:CheY-like chemotaxis protein
MKERLIDPTTRVLIVDPDFEFSTLLAENLRQSGLREVTFVTTSHEALELMHIEEFHIVLSSENLEDDKSGLDFATEIRSVHTLKPEIVILTEGRNVKLADAHHVGASFLVAKPINMAQLSSVIERMQPDERRLGGRVIVDPVVMGHLFGQIGHSGKKDKLSVEISNLGRGGFFYKCPQITKIPEVGQMIDFEITLTMVPNCKFTGQGVVRWARKGGLEMGAGVEFLSVNEEAEKLITAFVDLFKVKPYVPDES